MKDIYRKALNKTTPSQKAVSKAKDEYQKYQAKTLSAAEKDYLESLKTIEKQIEKK